MGYLRTLMIDSIALSKCFTNMRVKERTRGMRNKVAKFFPEIHVDTLNEIGFQDYNSRRLGETKGEASWGPDLIN